MMVTSKACYIFLLVVGTGAGSSSSYSISDRPAEDVNNLQQAAWDPTTGKHGPRISGSILSPEQSSSEMSPVSMNDGLLSGQMIDLYMKMEKVSEEIGTLEDEMIRMNDEMLTMMFSEIMESAPPTQVDDVWKLSENFLMENPVQTYRDGTRKFILQFDLRQFKPEEIDVRTSGNTLTVHAKHLEGDSGKSFNLKYSRSYILPKDVRPEDLSSNLSPDGLLSIEAPLPALEEYNSSNLMPVGGAPEELASTTNADGKLSIEALLPALDEYSTSKGWNPDELSSKIRTDGN